jgi:hypothetical protein
MNLHHNFIKNLNYEKTRNLIFFELLFQLSTTKIITIVKHPYNIKILKHKNLMKNQKKNFLSILAS